jgi:hypothetical protein
LRKKVADAEARLSELRAELAKAEGQPTEFKAAKMYPKKMAAGDEGPILNPSTRLPLAVHVLVVGAVAQRKKRCDHDCGLVLA